MKDSTVTAIRWLEIGAWTTGALLLASYAGVRTWSAQARDEGIAAMQKARADFAGLNPAAANPLLAAATPPTSGHHDATSPDTLLADEPDTSTWDAKRRAEYRDSLKHSAVPEAVLRIPQVNLAVPVYPGTSEFTLNRGAGHIEGTPGFDTIGNVGIAAHRDGFFRVLKDVKIGDALHVETISRTLNYRISSIVIVDPSDVSVLAPTGTATVTLVTCYPFYHVGPAPKRFIVHATVAN